MKTQRLPKKRPNNTESASNKQSLINKNEMIPTAQLDYSATYLTHPFPRF